MNLRANTETKFLLKYLIIGIACLGFAGLSTYDSLVKYPGQIPRAKAWEDLQDKIKKSEDLSDEDIAPMWREIAKANGWPAKRLKKSESVKSIKGKVAYNYLFIVIGLIVGLPCVVWYLKNKGTWIESTSDTIRSSRGDEVKLAQITRFDKKKWEKKGIGVIHYQKDNQQKAKFIIDDLKYDRVTTDKIVLWLESKIPDECIVNGVSELENQKKSKATAMSKSASSDQ
ncbi:MAG: hypothetical protein P8J27_09665 [Mariniblastus sp.]|nr:hypothetical protein [Mariniblastus sp.]